MCVWLCECDAVTYAAPTKLKRSCRDEARVTPKETSVRADPTPAAHKHTRASFSTESPDTVLFLSKYLLSLELSRSIFNSEC